MYTKDEILRELKLELIMRKSVYRKAIDRGKMTRANANRKYGLIKAAVTIIENSNGHYINTGQNQLPDVHQNAGGNK